MKVLITTGPTREAIDPVRYLSNRSSGRMGFALAGEAASRDHKVILITGPVSLPTPENVKRIDVVSAEDMYRAVIDQLEDVDIAIHSAAVADYRPKDVHEEKAKKAAEEWTITLERTTDILGSMRDPLSYDKILVGFAAETENLLPNARLKLTKKGCDLVIANDVSRRDIGFDQPYNEVTLLFKDGREEAVPKQTKEALAALLCDRIESISL
ncbi:phosphopantothenoylcysteine decarboxylase [bacterium]|nr:phosphopantothenoylcysteine decarboxylase [bacterium]